jgi:peptidyl-prolyl cis-trans isomerase D
VLIVPMVIFGAMWVGGSSHIGPGGKAGELFGRAVSWETFEEERRLFSRGLQAQMGTIPAAFEPFVRQQTWDRLILKTEAKRRIRISDEQVAHYLKTQPTFQLKGAFSPELYYQFLRSLGTSPKQFEERVRDDLRLQRLIDMVKTEVSLTDEELKAAYAKTHERRRLAYLAFQTATFTEQAQQAVTEADLRTAYDAHQDAVTTPAQRRVEYLGLSFADTLADASSRAPTEADLQSYLEQHEDEFATAEGVMPALADVRLQVLDRWHIDVAQRRLTEVSLDLQDAIDAGKPFEELATMTGLTIQTTSLLSLPASDVPKGPTASMVREVFQTPLHQMTRVWQEPSGVFVLRAVEEVPATIQPFEQAQETVRRFAVEARAREAAQTAATAARAQWGEKITTGLMVDETWTKTAPLIREDALEGLGHVPAVSEALFAAKVGELSDVLETPHAYVLAVVEETLPFDEARWTTDKDTFRTTYLSEKQDAHLAAWLSDVRARARLKDLTATP